MGIDSDFVLAGHSLGGFLSARYAMKFPNSGDLDVIFFLLLSEGVQECFMILFVRKIYDTIQ